MDTFWLKITLMPAIIALVTVISRRWGNVVGGVIAGMLWVGGGILFFIALEQGKDFAFQSLAGVMAGLIGWLAFCTAYVLIGQRLNAALTLLASVIICLLTGVLLKGLIPLFSAQVWFLILLSSILVSAWFFPKVKGEEVEAGRPIRLEILLRMIMITAFVLLLTYSAKALGPTWSGILTPFPVITAVLAVFTHFGQGMHQVRLTLMGMYTGVVGFATFLLTLVYALPFMGIGQAFLLSLVVNVISALLTKVLFTKLGVV